MCTCVQTIIADVGYQTNARAVCSTTCFYSNRRNKKLCVPITVTLWLAAEKYICVECIN